MNRKVDIDVAGFTVLNPFLWLEDHESVRAVESIDGYMGHIDRLSEYAARVCYNSVTKIGSNPKFLGNVIGRTHLDVIEHGNIVLRIGSPVKIDWLSIDRFIDVAYFYDKVDKWHNYYLSMNINVFFRCLQNPTFATTIDGIYELDDFEKSNQFKLWLAASLLFPLTVAGFVESHVYRYNTVGILTQKYEDPEYIGPATDIIDGVANSLFQYIEWVKYFQPETHGLYPYQEVITGSQMNLLAFTFIPDYFASELKGFENGDVVYRFSFLASDISRSCTHQLVRHRKFSFSMLSQRYVENNRRYVIPPSIAENQAAASIFTKIMNDIISAYEDLRQLDIIKEDARFVLPNAACANVVFSGNMDALSHFIKLRAAKDAQWEIQWVANCAANYVKEIEREIING